MSGIGPKKMDQIRRDWQTHKAAREVLVALQGLGVGMGMATKIYQQYGAQAVEVVTTNPYQLALDIHGLGFLTADRLAGRLNLDPLTPARLAAGLLHLLDTMAGEGHVYVPEDVLLERTEELLQVPRATPAADPGRPGPGRAGGPAGAAGRPGGVQTARLGGGNRGGPVPGTPAHRRREPPAAASRGPHRPGPGSSATSTSPTEQAAAVAAALKDKVLIITGGPGTGKTTIVSCILDLYQGLGARVLLMAPTGRAAKRLSETTGMTATTIHRALEFSPQTGGFRRGPAGPFEGGSGGGGRNLHGGHVPDVPPAPGRAARRPASSWWGTPTSSRRWGRATSSKT